MGKAFSVPSEHVAGAPWSVVGAAGYLGISRRHLIALMDGGFVQFIQLGARRMVPDAELRRVAEQGAGTGRARKCEKVS
jgi:hypothetical protein